MLFVKKKNTRNKKKSMLLIIQSLNPSKFATYCDLEKTNQVFYIKDSPLTFPSLKR